MESGNLHEAGNGKGELAKCTTGPLYIHVHVHAVHVVV